MAEPSKAYQVGAPPVRYAIIGSCTKGCLTVINVVLAMLGVALVLAGCTGLYLSTLVDAKIQYEMDLAHRIFTNISGGMVPLGTVLVVVSVAGCIGTCNENLPLLKLYMWSLGLLLIVEATIVMGGLLLIWKTGELLQTSLPRGLVEGYRPTSHSLLDSVQRQMGCCGISPLGYLDYERNPLFDCKEDNQNVQRCSVPASCCLPSPSRPPHPGPPRPGNASYACGAGALALHRPDARQQISTEGCVGRGSLLIRAGLGGVVLGAGVTAALSMYLLHQVRSLLTAVALLHYSIYGTVRRR